MAGLYSIFESNADIKNYILGISKSMNIENCKVLVNTYTSSKYTINSLKQYCKENGIPYFERGEFDIFSLEEIEFIYECLNSNNEIKEVFEEFRNKYPKSHIDLTEKEFEEKLLKLNLIGTGKEMGNMRYTNDIVEYVKELGNKYTIEESLEKIQNKYTYLGMTMPKLEEMCNKYLIKFKNNSSIFTNEEAREIERLIKSCSGLKEVYNIFIGMFPNKCDLKTFIQEISNLDMVKAFNTKESIGKFSFLEEIYIEELLKEDTDNASIFAKFNLVFPNKYPYIQFITKLNDLKVSKAPKPKRGRETDPISIKLEEYLRTFNGDKTINELLEIVNSNDEFKNYNYKGLHNFIYRKEIPFKKESVRGGRASALTDNDWELIKSYVDKGYTSAEILEKVRNKIDVLKDITIVAFRQRLSKKGIKTSRVSKVTDNQSKLIKQSIYSSIYDDVAKAVNGNTIREALRILQSKFPELQSKMTYNNLIYFAKSRKLNYRTETKEEIGNRMANSRSYKNTTKSNKGIADEVYEFVKTICSNHTKSECMDIVNKKFNVSYNSTYLDTLTNRRGKLEFKKYNQFTDEMKESVLELLKNCKTKREVYIQFCKKYQGVFGASVFYKLLRDLELKENGKIIIHKTGDIPEELENITEQNADNTKIIESGFTDEQLTDIVKVITEESEDRYQPIIDEVNNTFERKCNQMGISGDTYSHLDEIIYALEVLTNYAKNKNKLVRLTNDHEDILEQYRREVEHEIELQPFQSTDTYCQNKLKAIGMRRREVKYTRDDLNLMSILLKNINDNSDVYDKTLESLKHRKKLRENSIFMPLVDTDMIDRLDWCKRAQLNNKRAYTPILKTNARIDRINKSKAQGRDFWTEKGPVTAPDVKQGNSKDVHRISTYRVKAEFLSLKGNPFVNKYYDVKATSEDAAKEKGVEYFDLISANNDNAIYQILDITRLNR